SVIIRADANADNLAGLTMKKHWRAKSGQPAASAKCSGARADDIVLLVPPGTIVRDRDRGNLLKDLVRVADEVTVAKGGQGGRWGATPKGGGRKGAWGGGGASNAWAGQTAPREGSGPGGRARNAGSR